MKTKLTITINLDPIIVLYRKIVLSFRSKQQIGTWWQENTSNRKAIITKNVCPVDPYWPRTSYELKFSDSKGFIYHDVIPENMLFRDFTKNH